MKYKIKASLTLVKTITYNNFKLINKDVNAQKNVVLGLLNIGLLSPRGAYKYLSGLPKFRVPVH